MKILNYLQKMDQKSLRTFLLAGWVVLNLLQSAFTELAHDEAYYWVYSRFLNFGYYDHPPVIALMIKAGYGLIGNELGVRLLVILMNLGTFLILERLTGRRHFLLLFALMTSVTAFQVFGFIAVPDAPLLFFTAAFFLCLKHYLARDNTFNTMLLSLVIALLLYSKYHGFLVLVFSLAANLSLFRRRSFYLLLFLSIVLYMPHILWQLIHDLPSYRYHVLYKSQQPYNPMDTVNYLLGQALIFGPLVCGFLFYGAWKEKVTDGLDRALKFTLFGFLIFFLLSTLNAAVEPNWTVPATVPLILLGHHYLKNQTASKRWLKRLTVTTFFLFLLVRSHLVFNLLPESLKVKTEFHGWDTWAETIQKEAGDLPVVFVNSYQRASKYYFYTGQPALSWNNVQYRRNQFDLWDLEERWQGEKVFFITNWEVPRLESFETNMGPFYYEVIDKFITYGKVKLDIPEKELKLKPGESVPLDISVRNFSYPRFQRYENPKYPVSLILSLFKEEDFERKEKLADLKDAHIDGVSRDEYQITVEWQAPKEPGFYYFILSFKSGWLPAPINSRLIRVEVKE